MMNCQDIAKILNDNDVGALSPSVVTSAREHLATCNDCAGDWDLHERMLAMPMPAPGPELLGWRPAKRGVAAALPSRRSSRGTLIVGALIAVAAAAAVYVAVEQTGSIRTTESPAAEPASDDAPSQNELVGTAADSSPVATDDAGLSAIRISRPGYLYTFTLVLVPSKHEPQYEETYRAVAAALVDKFRSIPHAILIEPASFDEYFNSNGFPHWPLPEGIDFLVQLQGPPLTDIDARTGQWTVAFSVLNSSDNRIATGRASVESDFPLTIDEAQPAIDSMFEMLIDNTFPPEDLSLLAEIRNTALDSTLPERDRLRALDELMSFPHRFAIFDESVQRQVALSIALTATEIVTNSPDPVVRAHVWGVVSGASDPYLVTPVAYSLTRDAADAVRLAAARRLALSFATDPVARAALELAALNDRSRTVRIFARWTTTEESDRRAVLAEMLSDPAVPVAERYAVVGSYLAPYGSYITRDSAEHLLAIAAAQPNNMYWSDITSDLGNAPPREVVPLLLERLRDDPNAAIRRVAAGALIGHQEEPGAIDALRYARDNDLSPEVRLAAFTVR